MRITWLGEDLALLPQRAVFWERTSTLLVADPHFGKSDAFRVSGVPVPSGTTADDLRRLDAVIATVDPTRIVVLGDLLHAPAARTPAVFERIARWRSRHAGVEIVLVRGNHDERAGDPPSDLGIRCVTAPLIESPFALCHEPGDIVDPSGEGDGSTGAAGVIAGHVHPSITLRGPAGDRLRLPCFRFAPRSALLPAFGGFTGSHAIAANRDDRVFAVAGDRVIEVTRSGDASVPISARDPHR